MARIVGKRGRRWVLRFVGVAFVLLGLILRVSDPYPVQTARLTYFDYLQRLSPRSYVPDLPVRVVDIDEISLAELGQWPWPRTTVARLVERLGKLGAAAVVVDILFAEPDRYSPMRLAEDPVFAELLGDTDSFSKLDNDRRFADVISNLPVVFGVAVAADPVFDQQSSKAGFIEIGERPSEGLFQVPAWTGLAPPLGEHISGVGGINVSPRLGSGVVRQVPLVWNGPTGIMPSLSIEALRVALQEPNIFLEGAMDEPGIILSLGVGPYNVPTTENGEIWVRFRRDHRDLYISALELLKDQEEDVLRAEIEGRIILVGTSAAGLLDIRETPLGDSVPGVSIHAQIIEQILLGEVLRRSDITAAMELIAFVALGLILISVISISGAVLSLLSGGIGSACVLAVSWWAFQSNSLLFDATFPLFGGLTVFGALASFQFIVADKEKRAIRASLSHYVAPDVLNEIEESGYDLELGGEIQQVTVMFADIRDFTPISESMPPTQLVTLLNDLFMVLGSEILAEKGTIDKFIGDSIMAFWNAPVPIDDHPCRAAMAALRMRGALAQFNKSQIVASRAPISIAIGCAMGDACVGNIGSRERFNYTVIGDVVNIAARIESVCRRVAYDIVVSEAIRAAAGGELATLEAGTVSLKGKSTKAQISVVVGDRADAERCEFIKLFEAHKVLIDFIKESASDEVIDAALANCIALAQEVEPGLEAFYGAVSGRQQDFRASAFEAI